MSLGVVDIFASEGMLAAIIDVAPVDILAAIRMLVHIDILAAVGILRVVDILRCIKIVGEFNGERMQLQSMASTNSIHQSFQVCVSFSSEFCSCSMVI